MGKSKRPKIGLALGSGGARGLAHIGIIKILEENNIPIDLIAGTSIGAVIGGFYAAGLDVKKIEEIALDIDWHKLFSLVDPHLKHGLIGGKKAKAFIESHIGGKKFENCLIPFSAVATDLKTGEIVILREGEVAPAIRASMSIPLVFKPEEMNGQMLVDGGLSAPVPVDIVKGMGADIIIAVNLDNHYNDENWKPGWYDIANNSLDILRHHLARANMRNADIIIEMDSGKNYWYDFVDGKDKILAGEEAAKKILPELKRMILKKSKGSFLRTFLNFFDE